MNPSGRGNPVRQFEARDAVELAGVCGDEFCGDGQRVSGNEGVAGTDPEALALEKGTEFGCLDRGRIIEGQDRERRQHVLKKPSILLRFPAFFRADPEFVNRDHGNPDGFFRTSPDPLHDAWIAAQQGDKCARIQKGRIMGRCLCEGRSFLVVRDRTLPTIRQGPPCHDQSAPRHPRPA